MSRIFLLFIICFFTTTISSQAQYSLRVVNPQRGTSSTQGIITDPEINIKPYGAYAEIEMVFTVAAQQQKYYASDSLEAVLKFELPDGSFIYDSWLWLDQNTIISADIVERNRAVSIYEGIVRRRRDPSLLVKTDVNSYQLNVYPMQLNYPRKVKIVYAAPVNWQHEKATIDLPWEIFATSLTKPVLEVTIAHNTDFSIPSFTDGSYTSYINSSGSNSDKLTIPANAYGANYTGLTYDVNTQNIQLYTYSTNAQEGIYQLVIPATVYGVNKNANTVFILDHSSSSSINSYAEIKEMLKATLMNDYSIRDSFNVFYEHNGNIIKAFNTWEGVNASSVNSAVNNIPGNGSTSVVKYEQLLTDALSFCATKNNDDAQVILLSSNTQFTSDQAVVDAMFNNIQSAVGSFKNKIHVVNYSAYQANISGAMHNANDIWYSKLVLASGGTLNKFNTVTNTIENGQHITRYDLKVPQVLSQLAHNSGVSTASYNVNIGVTNGFTYGNYNLRPVDRINLSKPYVATGKYSGSITKGTTVQLQAIAGSNNINVSKVITNINSGNNMLVQGWVHNYLSDLIGANNGAFAQEIIDSSINNRVLCDLTAFLATDVGDTIATNYDSNPNWDNISVNNNEFTGKHIKYYPSPFSDMLTIEFSDKAEVLEVFDVMGRKVFAVDLADKNGVYKWGGVDMNGNNLAHGMYMIVISSAESRHTVKVMKL